MVKERNEDKYLLKSRYPCCGLTMRRLPRETGEVDRQCPQCGGKYRVEIVPAEEVGRRVKGEVWKTIVTRVG